MAHEVQLLFDRDVGMRQHLSRITDELQRTRDPFAQRTFGQARHIRVERADHPADRQVVLDGAVQEVQDSRRDDALKIWLHQPLVVSLDSIEDKPLERLVILYHTPGNATEAGF